MHILHPEVCLGEELGVGENIEKHTVFIYHVCLPVFLIISFASPRP